MTTTPTTTAKVTGVDISNGQVHLLTITGPVLAGTAHGTTSQAGPFTCNCGVNYTETDSMIQHVAYYCPRLHTEA